MDMKFEVAVLPVADVDRAKAFYQRLGWRLDADISAGEDYRVVQFTPPHSPASIQFGKWATTMQPGNWWDWYAAYLDARERGSIPEAASEAAGRYMAEVRHVVV